MTMLQWGWWKKPSELPRTLGHPKNFVLTADETLKLASVLTDLTKSLEGREASAQRTAAALQGQYIHPAVVPQCFTLADALEIMIVIKRGVLALMELLVAIARARKEETYVELGARSDTQAHEGETGATSVDKGLQ